VVITDYPDIQLIENMRHNVENCGIDTETKKRIAVEGYLWGSEAEPLLSHLADNTKFNVIILSDTVCKLPFPY
jgi:EEF1A N-terminal glycine/lysine methyltransferase